MSVKIVTMDEVKLVTKPWGYEKWLTPEDSPYVLKEIFIRAPHRSSLQIHRFKVETGWIVKGDGLLHLHQTDLDPQGIMCVRTVNDILVNSTHTEQIFEGSVFHIKPGEIHRVEAITDITLIEASTPEVDDVIRLQDDEGRENGRIDSEHE
jgi:mannose-6-phosphate isomerase-like protein (cupin superfamily)